MDPELNMHEHGELQAAQEGQQPQPLEPVDTPQSEQDAHAQIAHENDLHLLTNVAQVAAMAANAAAGQAIEYQQNVPQPDYAQMYMCDHAGCGKMFDKIASLTRHARTHASDRPFICRVEGCDKAFSERSNLKTHVRTHTGEKPYQCQYCDAAFAQAGTLITHKRVHTGERPFACDFPGCGLAFGEKSNMTSHKRTHTKEKRFQCQTCSSNFSTKYNLKVHQRTHTADKPFACEFENCGKRFTTSGNLKTHLRVHTGDKPFRCPYPECGKQFTTAGNLKTHGKVHNVEKPWVCNEVGCEKRFATSATLRAHMMAVKHGNPNMYPSMDTPNQLIHTPETGPPPPPGLDRSDVLTASLVALAQSVANDTGAAPAALQMSGRAVEQGGVKPEEGMGKEGHEEGNGNGDHGDVQDPMFASGVLPPGAEADYIDHVLNAIKHAGQSQVREEPQRMFETQGGPEQHVVVDQNQHMHLQQHQHQHQLSQHHQQAHGYPAVSYPQGDVVMPGQHGYPYNAVQQQQQMDAAQWAHQQQLFQQQMSGMHSNHE